MPEYVTKDSGNRVEFITGSRRDTNEGKPRYDLIGKHMLRSLAFLLERGAKKYTEHNWKLGQPISRSFESMFRHMVQWSEGDDSEDHLAAVIFNAMSIIHVLAEIEEGRLPKELNDYDRSRG